MPWTNAPAAAFTECPWGSLLRHADNYSPYGVGFTKAHVYAAGGGPAFYIRPHVFSSQVGMARDHEPSDEGAPQAFHRSLYPFLTPFAPSYMPKAHREKFWSGKPDVDYSHEREWRTTQDFTFEYHQIQFVVLERYENLAQMDKSLKDAIGREKFLLMDVYRQIQDLWPLS